VCLCVCVISNLDLYVCARSALASFILQLCLLVTVLGGLTILREDAKDLVLGPLRSMLKIVARYAKNPLSQATSTSRDNISVVSDLESEFSNHMDDDENSQDDGFGTYETEQLITAVAKITDLLRKCWGKCISVLRRRCCYYIVNIASS
jgi:hypothetical protein